VTFSLFKLSKLFKAAKAPLHKKYPLMASICAVVFLALLKAPQRRESKRSVSGVSTFVPPKKNSPKKKGVFRVFKKKKARRKKFSLETTDDRERERERENTHDARCLLSFFFFFCFDFSSSSSSDDEREQ